MEEETGFMVRGEGCNILHTVFTRLNSSMWTHTTKHVCVCVQKLRVCVCVCMRAYVCVCVCVCCVCSTHICTMRVNILLSLFLSLQGDQ